MEGLFNALQERITGNRRRNPMRPQPITFELDERLGHDDDGIRTEFILEARIRVSYWCNIAQKSDAQRHAVKALAAELYSDMYLPLARLEHAISDGDLDAAMVQCHAIRDLLNGERHDHREG